MRLLLPPGASIRIRRSAGLAASLLLHAAALVFVMTRDPAMAGAPGPADGDAAIAVMNAPADLMLPSDPQPDESTDIETPPGQAPLVIDDFAFDIEKIRRRRHALFPFLTADVLFLERIVERTRIDPEALYNPLGREADSSRPPLAIDAAGIQRLVDSAWSRRDRWTKFREMADVLERHDPDSGAAADLVHSYLDQNLLQPYEDAATRDSKWWVMMELVSDHVDFIDFTRSFTRRDPSSRVTTELLFLLDELAQGSLDSMLMLLDTDAATDLTATFGIDREAFAVAAEIGVYYRQWLLTHGITSVEALVARYQEQRLRILQAVLETTPDGYRNGDARFLIGRIHFDRGQVAAALDAWSAIQPDETDNYYPAYAAILDALAQDGDRAIPRIAAVLGRERLRWLEFSRERLRAFGYEFNTF